MPLDRFKVVNDYVFSSQPKMYSRRGGFRYYLDEVRPLHEFYKMGFSNLKDFLMQALIRCVFRLVPNRLRFWLYTKLLRRERRLKRLSQHNPLRRFSIKD